MKILSTFIALLISFACLGQPGYKVDFKIKGLKDTTAFLGYYTGESTFLKDTARANSQGAFSFEGKQ